MHSLIKKSLITVLVLCHVTEVSLGMEASPRYALAPKSNLSDPEFIKNFRKEWLKNYLEHAKEMHLVHRVFYLARPQFLKEFFLHVSDNFATSISNVLKVRITSIISLFAMGAILGFLGDRMHYLADVLWYPDQTLWGQAWWVPMLFGGAALALAFGHRFWMRLLNEKPLKASFKEIIVKAVLFMSAYAATAIFSTSPIALTVALTLLWILIAMQPFSKAKLSYSLLVAVIGSLVEATLSALGQFYYNRPDILGIPMWLPALYLWAANIGDAIGRSPYFHSRDIVDYNNLHLIERSV